MSFTPEISLDHIDNPVRAMAPIIRYGGKGHMAKKLLSYLPEGKIYVEPYCGAASVFWGKKTVHPVEVLNDLDSSLVGLFHVLQDPKTYREFRHRIIWTPYSIQEFKRALAYDGDDPVMQAWAYYTRMNQGFSGVALTEGNWGRAFVTSRKMAMNASRLRGRMKMLEYWHDRLTRVQITHQDAMDSILYWDSQKTVFYLDPPYYLDTRVNKKVYAEEVDNDHHIRLVRLLLRIEGSAMLSGYDNAVYDPLVEQGWIKIHFRTACYAAARGRGSNIQGKYSALQKVPRTETIWVKGAKHGVHYQNLI